jgi:FkbM family methyltransferase
MKIDKHIVIRKMLKTDTPVILEIGAHYGEDSMKFLQHFPNAKLFCFEPDPRNIYIIKKYAMDSRIKLFELAVSDNDSDKVNFYQSYSADYDSQKMPRKYNWIPKEEYVGLNLNRSGASSLKRGIPVEGANIVQVRTVKLDSWLEENNIDFVDLLWVDVQGAERNVVEGAKNSLHKIRYIWIEYGEVQYEGGMTRKETIQLLKSNFSVVRRHSKSGKKGDLLFRNKHL